MNSRKRGAGGRTASEPKGNLPPSEDSPEPLVPVIDPELQRELEKADPKLRQQVERQLRLVAKFSTWRSEWPPPDILNEYAPEDRAAIMAALKARTDADIARADRISDRREQRMDRGQLFGTFIAAVGICASVVLGIYGNPWVAGTLGLALVVASVGGPSVARVLADNIYLKRLPQRDTTTRSKEEH